MTSPFSYPDKHLVVTGGATGVGTALLEVLAELQIRALTTGQVDFSGLL